MKYIKKKVFSLIFLCILNVFLVNISFGKAKDYTFWRDDWLVVWAGRYYPSILNKEDAGRLRTVGATLHNWFFIKVVGFDNANWQRTGMALKVINSLILFYLVLTLTSSAKVGFFSSVLYASSFGGLEAYSWTRLVAFTLTIIMLAFIFYVKSYFQNKKKYFILAILFSFFAVSLDMWRSLGLLVVIPLWEILITFSKKTPYKIRNSLKRVSIYVISFIVFAGVISGAITISQKDIPGSSSVNQAIVARFLNKEKFSYFLISIGNLVRSPLFPTMEEGSLSAGDNLSMILGSVFLIITFVISWRFLKKRSPNLVLPLVLMVWILVFYFPNWFYEPFISLGATHRYIAISAVAFYILIILLLNKIKFSASILSVTLLVLLNMNNSIKITDHAYLIRGREVVDLLWDKIVSTVPPGEVKSVFVIWGEHYLRGYVFDWSGPYPYAFKRGIRSLWDFPILVNKETAASLVCDPETKIPYWGVGGGTQRAGEATKIDKIYGWYIGNSGILEDKTDFIRGEVAKLATCMFRKENILVLPNLSVQSINLVERLSVKGDKSGLVINWKRFSGSEEHLYSYLVYLIDTKSNVTVGSDYGLVKFEKGTILSQSFSIFYLDSSIVGEKHNFKIEIKACDRYCDMTKPNSGFRILTW